MFSGQCAIGLIAKLGLVAFLRGFHSANGDICSSDFVPPTIESAPERVFKNRRFRSQVAEFRFPTLSMALFRLSHAYQNGFALFIRLATGQIPIRLRRLDFRAPIALHDLESFLGSRSIVSAAGRIFVFHLAQLAPAISAAIGPTVFGFIC